MSLLLGCMMCGAAGGKTLAIGIALVFGLMMLGTTAVLASSITAGDFARLETRTRPLEAESEARRG